MVDFVVGFAIAIIVGGAIIYIIRAKKRGVKCIGCPDSGRCFGCCSDCNGSFQCEITDTEE